MANKWPDFEAVVILDANGAQVTSFGGSGGTSHTDDAAFTAATDSFTPVGGIVTADSVDSGDGGAFAMLANRQQKITLYDSSGVEITSFGGGTQYTEGDTDASITGTALLFEGAADTLIAAPGTAANGLDVDVTRVSGTVTVDGSGVTQPVSHAALTELAAAIDTEVQVDIVGALPAGTNAIGKLAANSGVDIGDVDVTSLIPGTGATNLGKAEDAVHASGDVGVMLLGVRQDVQADFGADGDYVPLSIDGDGLLRVNAGVVSASSASEYLDDEAFTLTTDAVTAVGAIRDDALATLAAAEGDVVPLRVDSDGRLYVQALGSVDAIVTDGSNSVVVLNAGADASSNNNNQLVTGSHLYGYNGTTWDRLRSDTTNGLDVDVTRVSGNVTVVNGGTFATQVDGAALTALQLLDDSVVVLGTDTYSEATSKGYALGAVRRDADTTLVNTTNEWGPLQMDANGRLKVEAFSGETLPVSGTVTANLAAGTNNIGDVDVLSIAAGTNSIGNVGLVPRTSGGMTIFRSLDIDETEEEIKGSAGQVFSISAFNRTAAPLYLKFYNATAANVTVGSTTPVLTFVVPANADSDGAGFIWNNEIGFAFGTAITVACTTGVADNDTGAPGANDCVIDVGYA